MNYKVDQSRLLEVFSQVENEKREELTLNSKVLIIDGLNSFLRGYAANSALNDNGQHFGGVVGFLQTIKYAIARIKPTRCIIIFDGKGGSKKRRKIYPEYKQGRKVKRRFNRNVNVPNINEEQSMIFQLQRLVNYLEQLPVTIISVDNIEADDTIAYITRQILTDSKIIIMSTDQDFLQLVDERISVWSPTKKILFNEERFENDYGLPSKNFLTVKVLTGDKSDSINGVHGAGLKSIIKYISPISQNKEFNVKHLLEFVENDKSEKKLIENIKNSVNLIKRNYLLMQLQNVDIPGHTKLKIQEGVRKDIPQLVKHQFLVLFIQDKIQGQIKDVEGWLKEFIRLDMFRKAEKN